MNSSSIGLIDWTNEYTAGSTIKALSNARKRKITKLPSRERERVGRRSPLRSETAKIEGPRIVLLLMSFH